MPKPKTKKKRFIDPKSATTFALVHRSQKDPLAADPDAPQRLLQPLKSKDELKKTKEQEREFGVFYDDEYDYLQHLKSRDEFFECDWDEVDKFTLDPNAVKDVSKLNLPKEVFASKEEEEIGLLNKAAPHKGPLLDWDPDIVETLDDEFKHEVVYTFKDEDATDSDENDLDAILAEAREQNDSDDGDDEDSDEDDYTDYDSDEALDDVPSLEGGFSNFSDEETKSKFTSYSMSSSVIKRNDQLTQLDDQFEKFFTNQYDDDDMGALEMDEIGGCQTEDSIVMKQNLQKFEKDRALERQTLDEDIRKNIMLTEEDREETKVETLEVVEEEEEDKFDCESILTTYSTLYNHPKLIKEPSIKPIRISGKTGMPKDVFGKGLTAAALKQLDRENEWLNKSSDDDEDDDLETMTLASRVSQLSVRNKHETKDEKKARKAALKELRRERRVERKINRDAFKEEKNKQEKNAINLKMSCNQAIKLL